MKVCAISRAALVAALAAAPALAAGPDDAKGLWMTAEKDGVMRFASCPDKAGALCGTLVWEDDAGTPGDHCGVRIVELDALRRRNLARRLGARSAQQNEIFRRGARRRRRVAAARLSRAGAARPDRGDDARQGAAAEARLQAVTRRGSPTVDCSRPVTTGD